MTQKTIEEILREIPALIKYKDNPEILRTLYAELNPKRDLSGLTEGEFVNGADVLVVKVLSTNYYVGCPECFSKKEGVDIGTSYNCTNSKCNTQRVATKLVKWTLLGGDSTTKVILDFPPFGFRLEDGNALLAKVINIKGKVTALRDQRTDGKVTGKTPVIMVRDMRILSDVRDVGTDSIEAAVAQVGEGTQPPVTKTLTTTEAMPAPPSQPTPTLPDAKLKVFRTWMSVMSANAGIVTEAQLKAYAENNLKVKLEDVLPYVNKQFRDQTQQTFYTLIPEPTR